MGGTPSPCTEVWLNLNMASCGGSGGGALSGCAGFPASPSVGNNSGCCIYEARSVPEFTSVLGTCVTFDVATETSPPFTAKEKGPWTQLLA